MDETVDPMGPSTDTIDVSNEIVGALNEVINGNNPKPHETIDESDDADETLRGPTCALFEVARIAQTSMYIARNIAGVA
jgi:hypothetical protein